MRAYMTCPCAKGCGKMLFVLEDGFGKNRKTVIEDHLADCESVPVADRPVKKARGYSAKQLIQGDAAAIVPNLHANCQKSIADLQENVQQISGRLDVTERRLGETERRLNVYDEALITVLPRIELPLIEGRADSQIRLALPEPTHNATTTLAVAHEVDTEMADRERTRHKVIVERLEREKETLRSDNDRLCQGVELQRAQVLGKRSAAELRAVEDLLFVIDNVLQRERLSSDGRRQIRDAVVDMQLKRQRCAEKAAEGMKRVTQHSL